MTALRSTYAELRCDKAPQNSNTGSSSQQAQKRGRSSNASDDESEDDESEVDESEIDEGDVDESEAQRDNRESNGDKDGEREAQGASSKSKPSEPKRGRPRRVLLKFACVICHVSELDFLYCPPTPPDGIMPELRCAKCSLAGWCCVSRADIERIVHG